MRCQSEVPWDILNLATLIPASRSSSNFSEEHVAGPIVATILTWRIENLRVKVRDERKKKIITILSKILRDEEEGLEDLIDFEEEAKRLLPEFFN